MSVNDEFPYKIKSRDKKCTSYYLIFKKFDTNNQLM